MNDKVYRLHAPGYWTKGLSPLPISIGTKRPNPKCGGFNAFSNEQMSKEKLDDYCKRFGGNGIGLVLGCKVLPGKKLVAIDIDHEGYVAFVKNVLGSYHCAKRGQKGLTIFAVVDLTVSNAKWRPQKSQKPVVELLSKGSQTVIPPTVHPDTEKPYEWVGASLLDTEFTDLPEVSAEQLAIIQRVVENDHAWALVNGIDPHDSMLKLTASGVTQFDEDDHKLAHMLNGLLPVGYKGNTNEETRGMLKTAREKMMGWRKAGYEPGEIGPRPLGYTDDSRYVFLDARRMLRALSSAQLTTKSGLMDMADRIFWMTQFPITVKDIPVDIDAVKAGDALMQACREHGPFILSRVRGRGVWREGDHVVVNAGGVVPTSDRYTYVCFEPLGALEGGVNITPQKVLDFLRMFCWRNPLNADLLFGWLVLAPACGALEWRPHAFLNGPKNTGKTTILQVISDLLKPMAINLDGQSTEAGIRQKLKADSLPVVLDEFESDGNPIRMASVMKLARSASSGNDAIARGTPDGRAMEFLIRSTFLFGGINPRITTAADASRIVLLELVPHQNSRETKQQIEALRREIRAYSPGWCHQAIGLVPLVQDTVSLLKAAFPPMDSRHEINMATLLAGVWLALNGRVPTPDEANEFATRYEGVLIEHAEAHEENDAEACLSHLLGSALGHGTQVRTIGDWLALLNADLKFGPGEEMDKVFRTVGIRIEANGICVSNRSPGLEKLYANTRWSGAAWRTALRRLPGSEPRNAAVYNTGKDRGTFIPFTALNREDVPVFSDLGTGI